MNNKDFITELSRRIGKNLKETSDLTNLMLLEITHHLEEGSPVSIQGFGTFEVKKKNERISVNPSTQQRMLVPPKLILNYRPAASLKEKFK